MLVYAYANGMVSSSIITESSICEAFFDFFESLIESDLLNSKEETLEVIDRIIKKLQMGHDN